MRRLVSSPRQVILNIQRFTAEIEKSHEMQARLGLVHDWYAIARPDGAWAFAPSKFVGYRDNTIKEYLETYQTNAHGGETEQALKTLSAAVDPESRLARELINALEEFLDRWDRKPRRGSQIRLVNEEEPAIGITRSRRLDEAVLSRISSNPAICGGRPCIKGTRMRVVDIVEAIAHGATRDELLRDFDYLTADDIAAALLYAARSADHRIVRAA